MKCRLSSARMLSGMERIATRLQKPREAGYMPAGGTMAENPIEQAMNEAAVGPILKGFAVAEFQELLFRRSSPVLQDAEPV
jgi:hypothetical protein